MSRVLDDLGMLHIITGRVIYTSGVPALTSNDGSATIADTGTGNATITLGDAFLSAPAVVASPLKATHSETAHHSVTVEQATTTTLEFRYLATSTEAAAGAGADPADGDGWMFIAIGLRNN